MPPILHLFLACSDTGVVAGKPAAAVSPESIDFGEVVVGTLSEIGVNVENTGIADLEISGGELDALSSPDFQLIEFPSRVAPGEAGLLRVAYAPDVEAQDLGAVLLETNEEERPLIEVPIVGTGVRPLCDVDPEILYFGTLAQGESKTLPVQIAAAGTGDLRIRSVAFAGSEADAYSFAMVDGYAEPYVLGNGFAITMQVTFTPPSADEFSGEIVISTNDPDEQQVAVHLYGNTVDDPTQNENPVVEILDPNGGKHFLSTDIVSFNGHVYDQDEPATNLTCTWYANGSPIAAALPNESGDIAVTGSLPAGEIDVALRCFDSAGAMGEDVASVTVFDPDEPLPYTISGGVSLFDYFSVDDDVELYVNGTNVFTDASGSRSTLAPVEIEVEAGAELRIVGIDQNTCKASLDGLVLHWGSDDKQFLNAPFCRSACDNDSCYDPDYDGPWPGTFLDETYTIEIP